jgi:hypothetical protein
VAQQGSGPPRSGPLRSQAPRSHAPRSQAPPPGVPRSEVPEEEDYPAWVIPRSALPPRPPRSHRTPRPDQAGDQPGHQGDSHREEGYREAGRRVSRDRGRAQATRARRAKRRLVAAGSLVAAAALVAVLVIVLLPGAKRAPTGISGFVTTYQPGELRSVPSTCGTVSAGTLGQYLPGSLTKVSLPGLTGKSSSQCDWTLDHKPMYRLLEVIATAYAPSGLASGNGSATAAATDAFTQARYGYLNPAKGSDLPRAQINTVSGLGKEAFSAFQVLKVGAHTPAEVTTDRITVLARYRNVLITVEFSGIDHAGQGGYGPVEPSLLQAGAVAAAREVLAKL